MATVFYVTPTGSDSNTGQDPGDDSFLTIARAIYASTSSAAWDATTIKVLPSASTHATYYEGLSTQSPLRQGITIEAITTNGIVYLDAHGKSNAWNMYNYSTLRNIYVTGSNGTTSGNTIDVYTSTGTPSRIEDCTFDNCTPSNRTVVVLGQDSSYTSGDTWIKRCTFKNLNCTRGIAGPLKGVGEIESILVHDCTFTYNAISAYGNFAGSFPYSAPAVANMGTVVENVTIDGCTSGREIVALGQRAYVRNCIVSNCDVTNDSYYFFGSQDAATYYGFPDNKAYFNCIAFNNTGKAGNFWQYQAQTSSCFVDQDPGYNDRDNKDFSLYSSRKVARAGITVINEVAGVPVHQSIAASAGTSGIWESSASFDINSASYLQYSQWPYETLPHPIGCFQNPFVPAEKRIELKGTRGASNGTGILGLSGSTDNGGSGKIISY